MKFPGQETDWIDWLLWDEPLVIGKGHMRNKMTRRFETIRLHRNSDQPAELADRPIVGQKHKRARWWSAFCGRAAGKTNGMAKRDFKRRHFNQPACSLCREFDFRSKPFVVTDMLLTDVKSLLQKQRAGYPIEIAQMSLQRPKRRTILGVQKQSEEHPVRPLWLQRRNRDAEIKLLLPRHPYSFGRERSCYVLV